MKVLVTGAKGFVGRNLVHALLQRGYEDVYEYDIDNSREDLMGFCSDCEFVYHLAGVNRPKDNDEFISGNIGFTSELLDTLRQHNNKSPILISSSVKAESGSPYGWSKLEAEKQVFEYGAEQGVNTYVYRLPNLFGKWCRPNYNSVVATFCHNIARGIDIVINGAETEIELAYIDDVCFEFISKLEGSKQKQEMYLNIPLVYKRSLGRIAELIYSFHESRNNLWVPDMSDAFSKKLYAVYLTYLPEDNFEYALKANIDNRGAFAEFIRFGEKGQISINTIKPGITRGNHWHNTKTEKFLVVSGNGTIRLRRVDSRSVIEYYVEGEHMKVVDIPPGYTHNIENLGKCDMVTVMWASEEFDPQNADTYPMEV